MISLANSLVRAAPAVGKSIIPRRNLVSGPPTVRMPFMEKALLGTGMIASMFIFPLWVLINVKHYRGAAAE